MSDLTTTLLPPPPDAPPRMPDLPDLPEPSDSWLLLVELTIETTRPPRFGVPSAREVLAP